jgi:hypothetical protein
MITLSVTVQTLVQLSGGPVPVYKIIFLQFGNNVSMRYKYKYYYLVKECSRGSRPLGGLRVLNKIK